MSARPSVCLSCDGTTMCDGTFQAAAEDGIKSNQKPINVTEVMDTWIKQMGYPVVTITRDYSATSARVTQFHFLMNYDQTPNHKFQSQYE